MSLAKMRKDAGLTQKDVAKALGTVQATVAMWETGKSTPSFKNLCALSSLLNVSFNELCAAVNKVEDNTNAN